MLHECRKLVFCLIAVAGTVSPAFTEEAGKADVGEFRDVLHRLQNRKEFDRYRPVKFRFDHLGKVVWPAITIDGAEAVNGSWTFRLVGDARLYKVGDRVKGAQILSIDAQKVTLQKRDQRREFPVPKGFPVIAVHSTKQVDGKWTAMLDDDTEPHNVGDVYKGTTIVEIADGYITAMLGDEQRTIRAEQGAPAFPELKITGVLRMQDQLQVFFEGISHAKVVGDEVAGGKILQITRDFVRIEYLGEEIVVRAR